MKKAVLFDIDGTLLDAWDFVFDAVKYAISTKSHKLTNISDEDIKRAMGRPLAEFYKTIVPKLDPSVFSKTHREFQEQNFHLICKPFPKTKNTLKKLKEAGFLMAAVSNRSRGSLINSLDESGIAEFFGAVICPEDVINPKPHQEHLLTALKKLGAKSENAYMVGDTDQDILAGKNANVKTIGVTYGFFGKDIKKHNPDHLIDGIEEVLKIVK